MKNTSRPHSVFADAAPSRKSRRGLQNRAARIPDGGHTSPSSSTGRRTARRRCTRTSCSTTTGMVRRSSASPSIPRATGEESLESGKAMAHGCSPPASFVNRLYAIAEDAGLEPIR